MAYEPKPNTFSLFQDSDDRIEQRKIFVVRRVGVTLLANFRRCYFICC